MNRLLIYSAIFVMGLGFFWLYQWLFVGVLGLSAWWFGAILYAGIVARHGLDALDA